MPLKAKVEKLDDVAEPMRALYRKDGDSFVLDVEPVAGFALEDVTGLKTTVQKLRSEGDAARQRLEALKDIDPDRARDALKKVDAMRNWTPEDKVREQIEARTKEIAAAKDAELATITGRHASLLKQLESVTVDRALLDAASKAKFTAPQLIAKVLREHVGLDDKLNPVVRDAGGAVRTVVNNDGTVRPLTVDEFVAEQAKTAEFAPLVAGMNATGTKGQPAQKQSTPNQMARPADAGALIRRAVESALS